MGSVFPKKLPLPAEFLPATAAADGLAPGTAVTGQASPVPAPVAHKQAPAIGSWGPGLATPAEPPPLGTGASIDQAVNPTQETGSTEETVGGTVAGVDARMGFIGSPQPHYNPNTIRPAGFEHTPYDALDYHGKDKFREFYKEHPEAAIQHLKDSTEVQSKKDEALADLYSQEADRASRAAAERKFASEQDQANLMRQQQELQAKTTEYAQSLHSEGNFWKNPGNIVSAIAYALMPITSNDPTIGVKMIDSAIARDLAERRADADSKLGALRSNIAGFREIMGNREAGDLAAEAAARAVAADQVKAMAQRFQSPLAKAQAQAMIESLTTDNGRLYMDASKARYNGAGVVDKQIEAARPKGEQAWSPWGSNKVNDPAPVTAQHREMVQEGKTWGYTKDVPKASIAKIRVSSDPLRTSARLAIEGQLPGGSNMLNAAYRSADFTYLAVHPNATPMELRQNRAKMIEPAEKEIAAKSEKLTEYENKVSAYSSLKRSISAIENSKIQKGQSAENFMNSTLRATVPDSVYQYVSGVYRSFGNDVTEEEKARAVEEAAQRALRQQVAFVGANFRKEKFGASFTPADQAIYNQILDPNTMKLSEVRRAVDLGATDAESLRYHEIQNLSPLARLLYLADHGTGRQPNTNVTTKAPRAK